MELTTIVCYIEVLHRGRGEARKLTQCTTSSMYDLLLSRVQFVLLSYSNVSDSIIIVVKNRLERLVTNAEGLLGMTSVSVAQNSCMF